MSESGALEHARRAKRASVRTTTAQETPNLATLRAQIEDWEKGRSSETTRLSVHLEEHRAGAGAAGSLSLALVWALGGSMLLGWPIWLAALTFMGSGLGLVAMWLIVAATASRPKGTKLRDKLAGVAPWWVLSALQAGVAWLITNDGAFTGLVGLFAVLLTVFVWPKPKGSRTDQSFPLALPEATAALVREIPEALPAPIASAVDEAFVDYAHLREAMETLHPGEDIASIEVTESAEVAILAVLRQASRAARLAEIAGRRPDDAEAQRATAAAVERLRELGRVLKDATSATLRLAATSDGEEMKRLAEDVSKLRALAAAQEELSELERG